MTEILFIKTGKEGSSKFEMKHQFVSFLPSGKHLRQSLRNISTVLEP